MSLLRALARSGLRCSGSVRHWHALGGCGGETWNGGGDATLVELGGSGVYGGRCVGGGLRWIGGVVGEPERCSGLVYGVHVGHGARANVAKRCVVGVS